MDLGRFPRRKYTAHPTPIEPMPILSSILSSSSGDDDNDNDNDDSVVHLWIKRDDQTGLTGGGNKTRKLEFVMADAIQQCGTGCTIITTGAVQSNHCRLTLSACNKESVSCCLVLEERVPNSYQPSATGNNYLFHLLGAEKIIKVAEGKGPAAVEKLAAELKSIGRKVYCIPGGASNELGATGYCACAAEIQYQQFSEQLPSFHSVVTASGSGGTHAGLVAGLTALRSPTKVVGISTRHPKDKQTQHILDLARRVYKHVVGISSNNSSSSSSSSSDGKQELHVLPAEDSVIVKDDYVGEGYSLPTVGMEEAVTLFARTEGILLDPVYSGKAAAGLIDLVRKGYFPKGSNVLFLHTGGAPSLYHYQPLYRYDEPHHHHHGGGGGAGDEKKVD